MIKENNEPEYWLRGPVNGIPTLLQPVAHALLQAGLEIPHHMANLPDQHLWKSPAGLASPAFHLQHIAGVIDRLFTYAQGDTLSSQQLLYLKSEGKYIAELSAEKLLDLLQLAIEKAIEILKLISPESLSEVRYVGRQKIQSTVGGLLFHSAEHTMRHTGQLLVTVRWLIAADIAPSDFNP